MDSKQAFISFVEAQLIRKLLVRFPPTTSAILFTALKSPGLAKGNPASITSTPNLAS